MNAYQTLVNKTGEGNDFLGWVTLPNDYDKEETIYEALLRSFQDFPEDSEFEIYFSLDAGGVNNGFVSCIPKTTE